MPLQSKTKQKDFACILFKILQCLYGVRRAPTIKLKKHLRYDGNFVERKGIFSKLIIFELKPALIFEICKYSLDFNTSKY